MFYSISLLLMVSLGLVALVVVLNFIPVGLWISALAAGVKGGDR